MKLDYKKNFLLFFIALYILTISAIINSALNLDRMQELAKSRYGNEAEKTVIDWRSLILTLQKENERQKIIRINDFFNNRINFVEDFYTWRQKDYWATPLETMGRAQGDCEDFTIAKYSSLILLDIPIDKLRLTYVKAKLSGPYNPTPQAHMVLAYYPSAHAEPLILDNIISDIRPASQRRDLTPVYSFNSSGLWIGNATRPTDTKPESRFSRWRGLLARMQAEGL